jgi:hypothetical protein
MLTAIIKTSKQNLSQQWNYPPLTVHYQLSTINYPLSTIHCPLSTNLKYDSIY